MSQLSKEPKWSAEGKNVIITGATSGIGLAAAKALAAKGARIGLVARNEARASAVKAQICSYVNGRASVDIFLADMASQQSIRQLAADILAVYPRINILINNAGALFENHQLTDDGVEMTWALNHLGPFLLTNLLLKRMEESSPSRIITTSSHGHKMAKKGINFNDLSGVNLYSPVKKWFGGPTLRYGETKLANILFTLELGKRLEGSGVTSYCFDPGLVATNFNQNNGKLARATMAVMRLFSKSPEKGAETLVWLAGTDEVACQNGLYYAEKKAVAPIDAARDERMARMLWKVSEEQTMPYDMMEK